MRCEEIMKKNVYCASPEQTVEEAARTMRDRNLGFLPICDGFGRVLGALTDRDIALRIVATGRSPNTTCAEVMTREVVSCSASDHLLRAQQQMIEHQKSRIVCLDDRGCLAGVISLSDIAQRESDRHLARTMREVTDREAATHH